MSWAFEASVKLQEELVLANSEIKRLRAELAQARACLETARNQLDSQSRIHEGQLIAARAERDECDVELHKVIKIALDERDAARADADQWKRQLAQATVDIKHPAPVMKKAKPDIPIADNDID